jgi:hypothetical protein
MNIVLNVAPHILQTTVTLVEEEEYPTNRPFGIPALYYSTNLGVRRRITLVHNLGAALLEAEESWPSALSANLALASLLRCAGDAATDQLLIPADLWGLRNRSKKELP